MTDKLPKGFTRKFLYVDMEKGWAAFEVKINDVHECYEYLEIEKYSLGPREWPHLKPPEKK